MGHESETSVSWEVSEGFELDGYKTASSEYANQYNQEMAKKGIINKIFVAEIHCIDGSVFQIPVIK